MFTIELSVLIQCVHCPIALSLDNFHRLFQANLKWRKINFQLQNSLESTHQFFVDGPVHDNVEHTEVSIFRHAIAANQQNVVPRL